MSTFEQQFATQEFANGYELVNGVRMHEENGAHFQIPPDVIKRHVREGQFVELRIDSPRFSVHTEAETCSCPSCNGEMRKPILRHEHPATLLPLPEQNVPSRGWGEDFWVQIIGREDRYLKAVIDNPLVESRLHELRNGDVLILHEDHILAVHGVHREELVLSMDAESLKELAAWLGTQN